MWEICKNYDDAASEFDRTITFIHSSIEAYRNLIKSTSILKNINGIFATFRRLAIGIMLCLGPYNYPINETYASLIPALLMGNIIIVKIPMLGGLAHFIAMEAFANSFPKGVVNFVSGSGRQCIGPLMRSGFIDILAFIGSSKAADAIIQHHPHPHRLKLFLQLEAKNLGIVLPDADLNIAVEQITVGATSFNGQRCTAIKLIFVHQDIAEQFVSLLSSRVDSLAAGLPWDSNVTLTPLPEPHKPRYISELIADALAKGATVRTVAASSESVPFLVRPAVVYPVTQGMRLWTEEQFGPVVPVAVYKDFEELHSYLASVPYGQQAAVFSQNTDGSSLSGLVSKLALSVGRINVNTQCSRSPDSLPFSARR